MWNFGVPYKLKHYLDVLTMPGTLFGFDPATGYIGLLKDKRARAWSPPPPSTRPACPRRTAPTT